MKDTFTIIMAALLLFAPIAPMCFIPFSTSLEVTGMLSNISLVLIVLCWMVAPIVICSSVAIISLIKK